jgi:RND family efflux transporter MFP subunit
LTDKTTGRIVGVNNHFADVRQRIVPSRRHHERVLFAAMSKKRWWEAQQPRSARTTSQGAASMQVAVRACALTVLAVLFAACDTKPTPAAPGPEVTVARVIEREVRDWDEFTGRFQAPQVVEIRPRVSGYIDKVEFAEGKLVHAGDVLFRIDPRPYKAELDRAQADLARYRTAQELATIELERVQKLKETGAVSREEVDERISGLHQAIANSASAKAAVDIAALNVDFSRVTSPINGRVSRAEITRGNLIVGGPNGGTLLTTVVSLDPIYVYFEGDEAAYLRYSQMAREGARKSSREVNNPVQVGLSSEDGWPHAGYVDFVDNQLNSQTGTLRARAVLDNKDGVFTPGLFARVRLLGSGDYRATLVEDRAIGTDQSNKYVLVVGSDNKAEYRKVTLGRLIDGLRVVREGLSTSDTVVLSGLQRTRPGAAVTPRIVAMGDGLAQESSSGRPVPAVPRAP